jgi:hypothetical protein
MGWQIGHAEPPRHSLQVQRVPSSYQQPAPARPQATPSSGGVAGQSLAKRGSLQLPAGALTRHAP